MYFKITREEFQQDVLKYLQRVREGESFVVMQDGEPLAQLIQVPDVRCRKPRQIGQAKGQFVVPDNFNDPLTNEELLQLFGSP